ncbi:MAG: type II secretion system F family protein [Pseudomonadota bacterium]|nr:type II secretion system F family protein [Pseudomonadota bacterium]
MALELQAAPRPAPGGLLDGLQKLRKRSGGRIGARERTMFTERLALLLETGISLHEGLVSLRQQCTDPALEAILAALCDDILDGRPLSVALQRHPRMFAPTYVNLVAAAEDGGFLPQVLQQLIEMDEKSERMRSMLTAALSYPVFLVCFSTATVVFVLVGVFPKFSEMFARIRSELPASTRLLMAISDLLRQQWPWLLAGGAVLAALLVVWLRQPATRTAIDQLKLRTPGLRDLFAQIYLTQTLRVLGLSLANGVPLVDALHACRELVRNSAFRGFIDTLRLQVTEGRGIAYGFRQAAFVPALVQQMIATGEETGNLAKVMTRIADFYDRELTRRIGLLSRLAEPVMLLVMGSVVGVIVASLILPIFKLSRAVH